MNKVILCGNLTRDPETKNVGESTVTKSGLAVNKKYKDKEDTYYYDLSVWGPSGENFAKFLGKGRKVLIEGEWEQQVVENENGKRTFHDVRVTNWEFADSKKLDSNDAPEGSAAASGGSSNRGGTSNRRVAMRR